MRSEQYSRSLDIYSGDVDPIEVASWIKTEVEGDVIRQRLVSHGVTNIEAVQRETVEVCNRAWIDDESESNSVEPLGKVPLDKLGFVVLRVRTENDYNTFPVTQDKLFQVACAVAIKNGFAGGMGKLVNSAEGLQDLGYENYERYLSVDLEFVTDPFNKLVNLVPMVSIDHKQFVMLEGQLKKYEMEFYRDHNINFDEGIVDIGGVLIET